ncbi:MAG: S8 family peptidase [Candidatus Zixiibacteriota bacterium]|nr:MAG: S8 family peptidase [candidate division Zixibacteria bacterium]
MIFRTKSTVAFILTFTLLYSSAAAGRLSDELARKVTTSKAADLIKVWIQLPQVESPANLKASLKAPTRAERYRLALDRLKSNHAAAQRDLLDHLHSINRSKQTAGRPPKGHWIINVVEAEVMVEQLTELSARSDVEIIFSAPKVVSVANEKISSGSVSSASVEANLAYINAPAAWAAGYTGQGRVVCILDTGVDGLHPAIYNNWKGLDGDSAAAWFDPVGGEPFPHTLPVIGGADPRHGTATTGLVVGHDDLRGDTVGVALDAKWIAGGVVDVDGASIIDGFEWASNPDRDPNTIDDVPDVISHSWGVSGIDCENIFYTMIDNTEALGIVNIFSAGNEGSLPSTIRNPANRALDSLDCFAIGSINHATGVISPTSSRGPSDCNPLAVKPNVVAPGVLVRFPVPGASYSFGSGTSFAAPHVSGLVALLRQKNPNATVDEIKEAILTSTNELGEFLPNNIYGWGLIDCMAALNALDGVNPEPNVRVYSFNHAPIDPGDEVTGTLVLKNFGATVTGVTGTLIDNNDAVSILAGTTGFGTIAEGQTVSGQTAFRIRVADTVKVGSTLPIGLLIEGSNYSVTRQLYIVVDPLSERGLVTHTTGTVEFSISNFGTFGMADDSFWPGGGEGFRFMGGVNELFDGGLMIGTGVDRVSDGVQTAVGQPDGDFGVVSGGTFEFIPPFQGVAQQSYARFTDDRAEDPIGLTIEQNSYSFETSPYQDMVIIQYVLRNSGSGDIDNLYVGIHCDWDIVDFSSNAAGFESTDQFAWMAYNSGSGLSDYRGIKVLQGQLVTVYTDSTSMISCPPLGWGCYFNEDKMSALRRGLATPVSLRTGSFDLFQVVAAQTSLAEGEVDTVTFAFIAGHTFADIQATAANAFEAYADFIIEGEPPPPPPPLPEEFALHQNYPNPFNSGTRITFNLRNNANYTLSVYNILGRKVWEFAGRDGPGLIEIDFASTNLSSGVYLYRLEAADFKESKKMVLIR